MGVLKKFKSIYALLYVIVLSTYCCQGVDLVVFSFNRPIQLYALLESVEKYMTHVGQISVIYRASDELFACGYEAIKMKFAHAVYYEQSNQPFADFKPLTMRATFESPSDYVLFAVDDIVVTQPVDLNVCTDTLERTGAYGFYLRLGVNITQCYMLYDCYTPVPYNHLIAPGIYQFTFKDGIGDWGYPNTVDMTVYRKKDIKTMFESLAFHNPNSLEGMWAAYPDLNKQGLFFERSVMVNTPLNIVNENRTNRAEHSYTSKELLAIFNNGLKIDINPLSTVVNKAPHMAYVPTFVKRDSDDCVTM
jgi:hypothetical protein